MAQESSAYAIRNFLEMMIHVYQMKNKCSCTPDREILCFTLGKNLLSYPSDSTQDPSLVT